MEFSGLGEPDVRDLCTPVSRMPVVCNLVTKLEMKLYVQEAK